MRRLRSTLRIIRVRAFLLQVARATLRGTRAVWNALTSPLAKTIFGPLLLIAAFLIVGLLLWPFLQRTMQPSDFDERKEVVVLLVQGLAVLGGAAALLFTWLRLRAAERTIQISQEGQITERFTRAIQQLGDPKLEVRLGGIYALERIARDSPRDHWTIMEVLTAYLRENAHWKDNPPPAQPASIDPAPPRPAITPRTDIQAILIVLRRRPEKARKEERKNNLVLDLRGTDLRGAALQGAHMEWATLWDAHMEGATLWDAHMEGANLNQAHMERVVLWKAHMEGAELWNAQMEGAVLTDAYLEGAYLADADLEGAYLLSAHMEGADLTDAHMEGAELWNAQMEGADLSGAHLERANLMDAYMERAYLIGAHMDDVIGLTRAQVESATTDEDTVLPDYLKEQGGAPPSL